MTVEEKHMVFDQWDPSVDHYLQQKQQTENNFQDRKLDNLKQMFGGQIARARNHSDSPFAGHIKEKTGYDIDINEDVLLETSSSRMHSAIFNSLELLLVDSIHVLNIIIFPPY